MKSINLIGIQWNVWWRNEMMKLERIRNDELPIWRNYHGKVGKQHTIINNEMIDRPVREEVWIIDSMESENSCLFERNGENHNFSCKEARNVFANGLSAAALKWSTGLSMHGKREWPVNQLMVDDSCPRCSDPEHWNHVMQCMRV